ncbi:MAG: hypothetical protein EOO77_45250 [Oxalobacteraceae bacterium]|nr:MAG: hypothetical protein EOO77_45250 [Oxalobacteraceae bacterium]
MSPRITRSFTDEYQRHWFEFSNFIPLLPVMAWIDANLPPESYILFGCMFQIIDPHHATLFELAWR